MITEEQLKHLFGIDAEALYQYLLNKHVGGSNNAKGNNYENFFAVYNIATYWEKNLDALKFSTQVLCFVDDLVVDFFDGTQVEHYQIKDVQSLSWTFGKHPLVNDFENQLKIHDMNQTKTRLYLIVSNAVLADSLQTSIPSSLDNFSEVFHFPSALSISNLIRTNITFKAAIENICAISNPHLDTLEAVAAVILGVWDATDKQNVALAQLKSKALKITPNFLKASGIELSIGLKEIFLSLKHFRFEIENGYFKWQYANTDNGILPFAVGTTAYAQWENDILQMGKIDSFEQLEIFL